MRHDPLNDALATLRNAEVSGHAEATIQPASKLIGRVLRVLQEAEYIGSFEFKEDGRGGRFRVKLRGSMNDCGVIRPRFAVKAHDLDRYESRYLPAQDFGVLILTTNRGVLTHSQAKQEGVGGRLLAYVY